MFIGEVLFVQTNRIKGTSLKGDYDFTNVIVSDGFKSVELNVTDSVMEVLPTYAKGQKVEVEIDFIRNRPTVINIKPVAK